MQQVAAIVLAVLVLGCAASPIRFGTASKAADWAKRSQEIQDNATRVTENLLELLGGSGCSPGFWVSEEMQIVHIGPNSIGTGFELGDIVLAADGVPTSSLDAYFSAVSSRPSGSQLSFVINRNGQRLILQQACRDAREELGKLLKPFEAAANARWSECMELADALIRDSRYDPVPLARIRFDCRLMEYKKADRSPDVPFATDAYDLYRLGLERERSVHGSTDKLRGKTISISQLLRESGFPALADDLIAQLNKQVASPRPPPSQSSQTSSGTCFVVTSDGTVLTANHVVKDASKVDVVLADGRSVPAAVTSVLERSDLALLRIDATGLPYLPLADPSAGKVGQPVFTIGFPVIHVLGGEPKFTDGAISSLSGLQGDLAFMQISVPVQPGNSGGPLVNERGEVVGVVVAEAAIRAFAEASGTLPQNVNWAAKIDGVREMVRESPTPKQASSREEAVERAKAAVCFVAAYIH